MAWVLLLLVRLFAFGGALVSFVMFIKKFNIRLAAGMNPGAATESDRKTVSSPLFNMECWLAEFNVLVCGCCGLMANAATVWVAPGNGPYTYCDACLVAFLLFLTTWLILGVEGKWLYCMLCFDKVDWSKVVKETYWTPTLGPVMLGLISLTKKEIVSLRAVQAGQPDKEELGPLGGIGARHPKVRQLVIRPTSFENIQALDMHDLSAGDLEYFGQDLVDVVQALDTADTLYCPIGPYFKYYRKVPYIRLSCRDHTGEMEKIFEALKQCPAGAKLPQLTNTEDMSSAEDQVAFDVTEQVLRDRRGARLSKQSVFQVLATRDVKDLFELVGTIMSDTKPPGGIFGAGDDALINTTSYEVQFRGIKATPPLIVLRMRRQQVSLLPEGWRDLPEVATYPDSMAPSTKKKQ